MTITSPLVLFGDNSIAIKDDATFACPDIQSFVDLTELNYEMSAKRLATFEPNMWVLDGKYKIVAAPVDTGLVSGTLSGSDGSFTSPVVLTITFGSIQSTTDGMTLHFNDRTGDYCDNITVAYYNSSLVLIRSDNYTPTGTTYATGQAVSNFKKIVITMNSTNNAYRYARLVDIDFDTVTRFTGAEIRNGTLTEHIDPSSIELPHNTIEITLYSADGDFSIVSPAGAFANFHEKQPIDAYENIGDELIYLGRFYVDEWNAKTANISTVHAMDLIGILDKVSTGSFELYGDLADLISTMFSNANISTSLLSVDASLGTSSYDVPIIYRTVRNALQCMSFGLQAYATCSRSRVVNVKPIELASGLSSYDYTLTSADKGVESPVDLRPLITDVQIISHDYSNPSGTRSILFDGDLAVGTHTLDFGVAIYDFNYTATGGLVYSVTPGTSYLIVTVTTAGHLLFEAETMLDNKREFDITTTGLPATTTANIIRVEDAFATPAAYGAAIAQTVYDYYQQRYIQKTKLYASKITPGDSVLIDTQSSQQIKGIVEKMTTDLTGGFVSQVEIVGVIA